MSNQTELTPIQQFAHNLTPYKKGIESLLPTHVPVKKFMRTIVGAVQNNPDIMYTCDMESIVMSCQKAALDGLILDNREAALVPFKGKCTYMPMIAGILKKLRNSGQLSTITAQVVYQNDPFSFDPANDTVPTHNPNWMSPDRGDMIGVYAIARLKYGGVVVEIMNLSQIYKVKAVSATSHKPGSPWAKWPEEMARKTVLRRLAKYLPSSADVDQMFEHDNENYDFDKPQNSQQVVGKSTIITASINDLLEKEEPTAEITSELQMPETDTMVTVTTTTDIYIGTFKGESGGEIMVMTDKGAETVQVSDIRSITEN